MTTPIFFGDALPAIRHRGSHLQIIASAGAGKAEVVAQRFAELMADGADPAGITAFTFTERAAKELKARISARVERGSGIRCLTGWARCSWGRYTLTASACSSSTCRGTRRSMCSMSGG